MSVDLEEGDLQNIRKLQDISIVCSKTSNPYLKASKTGKYHVIGCDELADWIWENTNHPVEHHDQPKQVAAT
jgi:transaldolase